MKIAIIGAGPTGLITEKYALEQGFECDVFEQTGALGGTWIYTDQVGLDENGLPIHSSMYKDLRFGGACKMKIAIIGAGPSGLISAKYALEQGLKCDVFEVTGTLGGAWIYKDQVGVDENGIPIHSPMYEGLVTNLPKETMAFLDFPYPEQTKSYLPQSEVVEYFNSFSDHFNLRPHIKYYKYVTKVAPLPGQKWIVTVQDAKTKTEESKNYDAVFVCNGHYREPKIPEITGQDLFKGPKWHSQNYRTPQPFEGKKVLIIGAGPSGQEIANLIAKSAEHVYLSYKGNQLPFIKEMSTNLTKKPVVTQFSENGAVFQDGTAETFDMVLYCTGFKYSFSFLTEECGIKVEDNWVHPLHKHIVNIEHPTMCFVGLPFFVCVIPMLDIQARFGLAAITGHYPLPSKEDMHKKLADFMRERTDRGIPQRYAHQIGKSDKQKEYFKDLAETAGIRNIPLVVSNIYAEHLTRFNRNDCYKIVDDENFIRIC